jgi:hypothetical protein
LQPSRNIGWRSQGQKELNHIWFFNDRELEGLLAASRSKEILTVKGFAEKKVAKYGDEILRNEKQ